MQTASLDLILPHLPKQLSEAIQSPAYSEVCVCEDGSVFAEVAGRNVMEEIDGGQPTQTQLRRAVNAIARLISGHEADEDNPILEEKLPDGARIAVIMPPLVEGITITIRKFRADWFSLSELVANNMLSAAMAEVLTEVVDQRLNVLVSGATGSGKTTLTKALIDLIPLHERIVLLEDTFEIPIKHKCRMRAASDSKRSMRDLVKASLRHRPDRLIVGEVRDGAAYDLLQTLNTGQRGAISTLHASSAKNTLNRLAWLALQADVGLPFAAIQSAIGDEIHYVAHVERVGGSRRVTELLRVVGFKDGEFKTEERKAA